MEPCQLTDLFDNTPAAPKKKPLPGHDHTCHWPGCTKQVPPKLWGCREHWFMLPPPFRRAIWKHYVPGQEIRKDPSRAYIETARQVQEWILTNHPPRKDDGGHNRN
jgi:hypothetical protein